MTSSFPDDGPDPLRGASADEVDRRFAEIISGLDSGFGVSSEITELGPTRPRPGGPMDPGGRVDEDGAEQSAGSDQDVADERPEVADRSPEPGIWGWDDTDPAAERARRRELRRAEREAEYQFFLEEKARVEAEREADQEHFTPPEPPPLPRPHRRTLGALLLIALGLLLVFWPTLLPAASDLVLTIGVLAFLSGSVLLFLGMRHRPGGPATGDGWDDGAEI